MAEYFTIVEYCVLLLLGRIKNDKNTSWHQYRYQNVKIGTTLCES